MTYLRSAEAIGFAENLASLRKMLAPKQGTISGAVPAIANRASYFLQKKRNLEHWNVIRGAYTLKPPVDLEALRTAAVVLVGHHDGLRLQATNGTGGWREAIIDIGAVSPFESFGPLSVRGRVSLISVAREVQSAFQFPGQLFKVVHVRVDYRDLLFFVLHHLIADAFSADIIVHDFLLTYRQLLFRQQPNLPRKTTSYQDFSRGSTEFWSARQSEEARYWHSLPWREVQPLPPHLAKTSAANVEKYTKVALGTVPLTRQDVKFLKRDTGWQPAELILAACARAYSEWANQDVWHVALVLHGRESFLAQVDLSRTVGWISETVPVVLEGRREWDDLLHSARKQLRRASSRGKAYGVIRYLVTEDHGFCQHPFADVALNIKLAQPSPLGEDTCIQERKYMLSSDPLGSTRRVFLLSGGVYFDQFDRLTLSWDFSNKLFDEVQIQHLTDSCIRNLTSLFSICKVA